MKIISWLIILYPYLSNYNKLPFGMDIGTLLLLFSLPFASGERVKRKTSLGKLWVAFGVFCGFLTICSYALGLMKDISLTTSFVRYSKMLLAIIYVAVCSPRVDASYFQKAYLKLGVFCTWFLIGQTAIYYVLHLRVRGFIPQLTMLTSGSIISRYQIDFYRPESIFWEPTAYVNFMIPILGSSVLGDERSIQKYRLFFSLGVILSGSGNGYVALAALWILYIMKLLIAGAKEAKTLLIVTILAVILLPLILRVPLVQKSIGRFFSESSDNGYSSAVNGRLYGFELLKSYSPLEILIGRGFGDREAGAYLTGGVIYYNGIAAILAGNGILGLIFYLYVNLCCFMKLKSNARWIVPIIVAVQFSANTFAAYYISLYFIYLIAVGTSDEISGNTQTELGFKYIK